VRIRQLHFRFCNDEHRFRLLELSLQRLVDLSEVGGLRLVAIIYEVEGRRVIQEPTLHVLAQEDGGFVKALGFRLDVLLEGRIAA